MTIRNLIATVVLLILPLAAAAQDTASFNQAVQLYQAGQYQKSIEMLQASPITKESAFVLMLNHMKLGDSLLTKDDSLAVSHLEKALTYSNQCDQQMKEVEQLRNSTYTMLASAYSSMSIDCFDIGKYREALSLGQDALQLRKQYLGTDHPSYASSLSLLAKTHEALGHYQEAINLTNESLSIAEKSHGKESSRYATRLNNLSVYYNDLGNHSEAIRLCNQALQIFEKNNDTESNSYAVALSNLAAINYKLGNNHEALRISRQVLKLKEKTVGKDSPSYALSLTNHANYVANGNPESALMMAMEALNIQREKYGSMINSQCAGIVADIANYNFITQHYDNALKMQKAQLQIVEAVFGPSHPDYILSLNNLAFYYITTGNYEEGLTYAHQANKISQQVLDPNHPYSIHTQENIAFAAYFLNRQDDVEKYGTEATKRFTDYTLEAFPGLSVAERKKLWTSKYRWYEIMNLYAATFKSDVLVENAYNGMLLSKGLLLNSDIEMMRLIQESGNQQAIEDYRRLSDSRHQLQKLMQLPRVQRGAEADSLFKEVVQLERQLSSQSQEFGDYTSNLRITWKDVQKGLKSGDAAVEFIRYINKEEKISYLAYVLTAEMKSPQIVLLADEEEIRAIMAKDVYATDELTKAVWEPVLNLVKDKKRIFFAPDGELYRIGIEYLPSVGGSGKLSDSKEYYRISSTRYLAESQKKKPIRTAVVYGGLEYDTDVNVMSKETVQYASEEEKLKAEAAKSAPEDIGLRAGISYLPATKEEATDIGKMLSSAKIKNTLLTMSEGTEASFKSLSGKGIDLLHIATHGFFWTDKETKRLKNVYFLQADTRSSTLEDPGMARSGLLLAGANTSIRGAQLPKNTEDGILTAEEISQLDFRGMDLVVMSACQTGLGDITGDGVFGLQRGFKKAGANTLLMSLWKVDDTATRILMDQFYKNLTDGKSKHDAFLKAQQYLRTTENGKFDSPRFWAAFILLDAK